jgi:hypothetical protein
MHKQSNKDIQSSEVFPEGYNCYRKDRKDDTHGGVFHKPSIIDYIFSSGILDKCNENIKSSLKMVGYN